MRFWWLIDALDLEGNLEWGSEAWTVTQILHWVGNEGRRLYWVAKKLNDLHIKPRYAKAWLEDCHVCLYDAQTLQQVLSSAGFQNITRCKVGESRHTALSGIERHDVGSIADEFTCVVEATKPAL